MSDDLLSALNKADTMNALEDFYLPYKPKRKTKAYIYEVVEYAKNQAKWKAAEEWCLDRGYEFKVLTENELGIK